MLVDWVVSTSCWLQISSIHLIFFLYLSSYLSVPSLLCQLVLFRSVDCLLVIMNMNWDYLFSLVFSSRYDLNMYVDIGRLTTLFLFWTSIALLSSSFGFFSRSEVEKFFFCCGADCGECLYLWIICDMIYIKWSLNDLVSDHPKEYDSFSILYHLFVSSCLL